MKSDLENFEHGDEGTHTICRSRLEIFGGDGKCCICFPHADCLIIENENEDQTPKEKDIWGKRKR